MVNPLNIILPFLFAKPKTAATPPEKHPFQAAEEFASVLRTVADATDNDLGQRIYELAGRLSVATTLNRAEAVCYIRDLIENKIKKGMSANDAVREAFAYVTETYLTRPLGVFDKRPDVDMKGGGG